MVALRGGDVSYERGTPVQVASLGVAEKGFRMLTFENGVYFPELASPIQVASLGVAEKGFLLARKTGARRIARMLTLEMSIAAC